MLSSHSTSGTRIEETPLEVPRRSWFWIVFSFTLVAFVTVSPGDDGVASLLPEQHLSRLKLAVRGFAGLVLAIMILGESFRRNIVFDLIRFGCLFLFLGWAVGSTAWSAVPSTSLNQSGSLLILALLSIAISVRWKDVSDTSQLLKSLAQCLFGISVMLILLHFLAPKYGALTRSADGLLHATAGSATAALGFVITLLSRLIWNWRWSRTFFWIALPTHLATILISGNRWSLVVLSILVLISLAIHVRRESFALLAASVGLTGALYLTMDPGIELVGRGLKSAGVAIKQGQSSRQLRDLSGRAEMWSVMKRSFRESPWKGHGYFVTSRKGEIYVWYRWGNWTAHSLYLQLLVTTGIIGCVLAALFVIQLTVGAIGNSFSSNQETRRLNSFCFVVGLWYPLWGVMNSSVFGPIQPETVVCFVVIGLFLASRGTKGGR